MTREQAIAKALEIDPRAQYVRTIIRGRLYVFNTGWDTPEFTVAK